MKTKNSLISKIKAFAIDEDKKALIINDGEIEIVFKDLFYFKITRFILDKMKTSSIEAATGEEICGEFRSTPRGVKRKRPEDFRPFYNAWIGGFTKCHKNSQYFSVNYNKNLWERDNERRNFLSNFFLKNESSLPENTYFWLNIPKETLTVQPYSKYLQSLKENFLKAYPIPIPMSDYVPIDPLPIELYNLDFTKKEKGPLFKIVKKKDNFAIIADAGSGKSYSLQQIVLDCLKKRSMVKSIPIYVPLSGIRGGGLKARINHQSIQKFDRNLDVEDLKDLQNSLIFLFDGLDETDHLQREQVETDIEEFMTFFPKSKFVITSRPLGHYIRLFGYDSFEISLKSLDQVISTIDTFFKKDKDKRSKILHHLDKNPQFRELTSNPYYLTLICNTLTLALEVSDNIPNNVGKVYQNFIRIINDREANRKGNKIEFWVICEILKELAYSIYEENLPYLEVKNFIGSISKIENKFGTRVSYLNLLKTTDVIYEIVRSGFLRANYDKNKIWYNFAHFSWKDYFAASYLVDEGNYDKLQKLIEEHLTEYKWREVFLLVANLLPQADDFLSRMKARADSLVENDKRIRSLLRWAEKKATPVKTSFPIEIVRALYFLDALCSAIVPAFYSGGPPKLDFAVDTTRRGAIGSAKYELLRTLYKITVSKSYDKDWQEWVGKLDRSVITHQTIGHRFKFFEFDVLQIKPLLSYITANTLLVECLGSEYNISKNVRKKILNELLTGR